MTERSLSAHPSKKSLTETPGPGSYESTRISRRASNSNRGSNSFVSTESRMAPNAPGTTGYCLPTSVLTPGPGSYNVASGLARRKQRAREKPRPLVFELSGGPPSIPPQLGASPESGSVGPGQYSPSHEFVKRKPTSIDFSHSRDARKLWEPTNSPYNRLPSRSNPGPGSYDNSITTEQESSGNSSFMSRVKRVHQRETEERSPGPGVYEWPHTTVIGLAGRPPFGSNCLRGDSWTHDMSLPYTKPERSHYPGVGAYNLDDSVRKVKEEKRKHLLYTTNPPPPRAPFLTDMQRDCLAPLRVDPKPGPGAYNGDRLSESQSYNLQVEIGSVTFATKQERFRKQVFETKEGPDPGQYHKVKERPKAKVGVHTFKSRTARFPNITESAPPVGYYDIWNSWKPKQSRAEDYQHIIPGMSFESSSLRFDVKSPLSGQREEELPGPGQYDQESGASRKGPKMIKSRRFVGFAGFQKTGDTQAGVGPGRYTLERSLLRKSFNRTMEAPKDVC